MRDPRCVFRQDQLREEYLRTSIREDQCHVVIAASCRKLMVQLIDEVTRLESYFPGLRRLTALFPCHSCRVKHTQRKQAAAQDPSLLTAMQEGVALWEAAEAEDLLQLQALSEEALSADELNCDSFYLTNRSVIDEALSTLCGTTLQQVLVVQDDGNLSVQFGDCMLKQVYGAGWAEPPPRFYQEVR